jgi:hypothetical protein
MMVQQFFNLKHGANAFATAGSAFVLYKLPIDDSSFYMFTLFLFFRAIREVI